MAPRVVRKPTRCGGLGFRRDLLEIFQSPKVRPEGQETEDQQREPQYWLNHADLRLHISYRPSGSEKTPEFRHFGGSVNAVPLPKFNKARKF